KTARIKRFTQEFIKRTTTMPLQDLVEYFNQRISEEQGLREPPLTVQAGQVEGRFGGLRLASEFHPIRRADSPEHIVGHDAQLQAFQPDDKQATAARVFFAADAASIVSLDRLCRTIHMLNYLPAAHENEYLFLQVHPRHVLGVKRNHGAYFEEVIFRCGLSPRRVAITVLITPVYGLQLISLLEGLKNYQTRGYATAIKFDDKASESFLERYCIEFLYRITPDFVRLDPSFFSSLPRSEKEYRRKTSLLSVIHSLDTEFLVEGIENEKDAILAEVLRADLVKGSYYEAQGNGAKHRKALP
ncbi:MAG TPA: EAL domain-containing protein, partial [Methylococcaceae bacterium]|nr:EAL domain-containing protein [Methylococcaceae bacterium]